MKRLVHIFLFCASSLLFIPASQAAEFIEFVATPTAQGQQQFKPAGMPQGAARLEGSLYLNMALIERVYFKADTFTADIYTRDTIYLVKFGNADTRTIFRAVLSRTGYKAASDSRAEVVKEVAAQSGFVPVVYIYELSRK